nr:IS66 family transposase [Bacteroidota bacterium]
MVEKANIETLFEMVVGLQQQVNQLRFGYEQLKVENKQLRAENENLRKENGQLNVELSKYKTKKTSRNSSVPPSKDENRPIKNQSLREKSGKPVGGQKGHEGKTLRMTNSPDELIEHIPSYCRQCGNNLSEMEPEPIGSRQVIDIPPIQPIITEHRVYKITCKCGCHNVSAYPANVKAPVSYGSNIESILGYFHTRQYIPFARLQELFRDIFDLPISEGGLHYLLDKLTLKALPAYEMIRQGVLKGEVIGSDETGIKVNGKMNWFWTWQDKYHTLIAISKNRGFQTIYDNCGDQAKQAILIHDCWKPHFKTTVSGHQLCMAHLLRELNYLHEKDKFLWPKKVKNVFIKAIELKKKLKPSDYDKPNEERTKLENDLNKLLKTNIDKKRKESIAFQKRLLKYRSYIFTFLYHLKAPPDNNASERAIRNVKVKQKVSGQFKSFEGAERFAILRSIADTATKNGQNILNAFVTIANFEVQTD